ncbi:protein disulfide-isomerase domain-containing protein [Trichophyton rubrum D6]|uniref:protein disulfide-isomerase n=4 Tax=Trichophyton TaxID=5550 RepID=A0A178F8F5_TRIRU|nr:protein disulfide-isomerase domain-containing protein [Trichophyton rubrum CBS 118892]EZF25229.1 protein disulfide-isomerase domain-containing protein [Trichophyton rubrum MR850]EZF44293.1 protein disulfide-isomerase domain-containing protein [Trichophyton rubrum CBS 100081]EZF54932.1 protein disulfide-isomerase domain-containing protein [Trichophyton rubrum CBS 288.86]EZF65530.1 protein disulfide-isomerase domain-containing protein [Trichophyton rubrum CBS 289.86]EZF76154.1 protein disulfi
MLKSSLAALLVTLAIEAVPASGLYTKKSPVLQVDANSYDRLIARSNHVSIVEFYAPWCGHCRNLKPAYEKAAKNLDGLANVAAVDCDDDKNKAFCGQMGVKGFPTLKLVVPSKKPGKPRVQDYQGARSAKAIGEAVIDNMPNHVKRLTDKNIDEWFSLSNDTAKAILFSEKGATGPTLKALSCDFLGSISFGQIRNKEKSAVELFGISKFPALALLPGGDKESILYDGEMKKQPMMEFLSQIAEPNSIQTPEKPKQSKRADKSSKSSSTPEKPADFTETDSSKDKPEDSTAPEDSKSSESTEKEETGRKTPPLRSLASKIDLKTTCLSDTTGTCLLALVSLPESPSVPPPPATMEMITALGEISHKYTRSHANIFPFYLVPEVTEEITSFKKLLDIPSDSELKIVVVNGRRGWYKFYNPEERGGFSHADLEKWIDAVKFGEMEKKKIPEGALIVDAAQKPAKSEETPEETKDKVHETAPEPEPEQEQIQDSKEAQQQGHEEL